MGLLLLLLRFEILFTKMYYYNGFMIATTGDLRFYLQRCTTTMGLWLLLLIFEILFTRMYYYCDDSLPFKMVAFIN
jgi:hypothetical protein